MTAEFTIAVHALVFLNHKESIVSSDTLAKNVCTNPARIRKVMAKLKKAGLLKTKEGLEGGYSLARDASLLTLKDIGDAIEAEFVSSPWKSGDTHMSCLIASGMAGIMDEIYGNLNSQCRDYLQTITIKDIDDRIFAHGRQAI